MRVFGNLMNRIEETAAPLRPVVGMGATILMFSDRHAATITSVASTKEGEMPKWITIQQDKAIRTDKNGMSESQEYRYEPNTAASVETYTYRRNGTYVVKGSGMRQGTIVRVGSRNEYHDFSF
jgi:hypothetical protein